MEVELVEDFAAELDAETVYARGTTPELLEAAGQGEVDALVGGRARAGTGSLGADLPVAAHEWQIEEWGFESTGIELPAEEHVMAVPLGENGWLVRLERFLYEHREEAMEWLREETLM